MTHILFCYVYNVVAHNLKLMGKSCQSVLCLLVLFGLKFSKNYPNCVNLIIFYTHYLFVPSLCF
jgi:hypothetical protein